MVAPTAILALLGVAAPVDVWIRVLGALAAVLGIYYRVCGAAGDEHFMRVSVTGRFIFAALCVGLVLAVSAPPQLLIFGAIDVASAIWTARGLRKVAAESSRPPRR